MQLRAHDRNKLITFAHQAKKQCDYFCLECQGILRLRSGLHRQKHFYHTNPTKECRQHGKSMEHIQTQCAIKQLLGDDCSLEHPFPQINRIADCAWHLKRIVFEVQCSSITQDEISQRNKDYASAGHQVVWLLHDKRFNRKRLSAAELWLQNHPHYFTNIDAEGKGYIYDQIDIIHRGTRRTLLSGAPVNIKNQVLEIPPPFPKPLNERYANRKIIFEGDWLHQFFDVSHDPQLETLFQEALPCAQTAIRNFLLWGWDTCFRSPYRVLFDYLLEKACR